MNAQELLQEISDYCRHSGLAESTFGRRAVNDGKLTTRLRNGGRITTDTLDRIRAFITSNSATASARPAIITRPREEALMSTSIQASVPASSVPALQPSHSLVPKISPVRQHLQRKVGRRQSCHARARQHPSAPAGGAHVRCGRRRRHRDAARAARDA
jgi:hypothetical protein